MLVLSRREGETVVIGTSVVRILEIRGNTIRIGIDANQDLQILRGELIPEEASGELAEAV